MATKKTTTKKAVTKSKTEKADASSAQVSVAVGLTAAAVAAAGAYFLYGSKHAEKNRTTVRSWMLKAKAEVLEQLEDAKKMSREEFESVVAGVASAYTGAKSVSKADLAGFAGEMMEHWDKLEGVVGAKKKSESKKKATAKKKTTAKKAAPKKKVAAKKTTTKKKSTAKKTVKKKTEK